MKMKKFDTINVVPFIDIMLVLLVIVLTTATFVARGVIPLDLAVSKSAQTIKEEMILNISIAKNKEIFFNNQLVASDKIEITLQNYDQKNPINISCDKEIVFSDFVFLLDILKRNHFENLNIVTKY